VPDTGVPTAEWLLEKIAAQVPLLVEMTQALVRADSQTPPSDTGRAADIAAGYLAGHPEIEIHRLPSVAPVVNLVARLDGGRPGRRLVLNGHLDTYPAGTASSWSDDPLSGAVRDGRLYGRGSADMKGGIAALILVMKLFAEHLRPFPGELVLALAGDEESMGELGTQFLIDNVPLVRGDAVLVADVGSPSVLRCGEKGMIWLDLAARGRSSHGAHVHRGDNAILSLMTAISELRKLEGLSIAVPVDVRKTIAAAQDVSEPLGGSGEAAVMQSITVNVGQIGGGVSANLVPDQAWAKLDIRLPLGTTVAGVEREIESRLAKHPAVIATVTRRYEPTWTDPAAPISVVCLAAATEVLGGAVRINMRVGASDARLWRRAGLPTIVCGLTPHNLGGPDENLEAAELPKVAAIHALAALKYLRM
jgi:succinyl-diaminopimelate desuccinylase